MMHMELADKVRAAIDETERIAQAAGGMAWVSGAKYTDPGYVEEAATGEVVVYDEGRPSPEQACHIARHDPAAVLRRCAADRKILDAHDREHDCIELTGSGNSLIDGKPWELWEATDRDSQRPCFVVRTLAEGYGIEP